jgi:hypothetical protein
LNPLHPKPVNVVVADVGELAVHVPDVSMEFDTSKATVHAWVNGPTPPETFTVVGAVVIVEREGDE